MTDETQIRNDTKTVLAYLIDTICLSILKYEPTAS
jgi:hypothetical protein